RAPRPPAPAPPRPPTPRPATPRPTPPKPTPSTTTPGPTAPGPSWVRRACVSWWRRPSRGGWPVWWPGGWGGRGGGGRGARAARGALACLVAGRLRVPPPVAPARASDALGALDEHLGRPEPVV